MDIEEKIDQDEQDDLDDQDNKDNKNNKIEKQYRGFILAQLTLPSLAWKTIISSVQPKDMPAQYKDKITRKFLRKAIHGGRCFPYVRVYKNIDDPLIADDANSLYPSAMDKIERFPDIRYSVLFKEEMTIDILLTKEHGFIL